MPRKVVISPGLLSERRIPRRPRDLSRLPWLGANGFYQRQISLRHCNGGEEVDVAIQPRLTSDSFHALTNSAIAGLGAALISTWIVKPYLDRGELVELLPDWESPALPVSVIYPYASFYPARLKLFVELMREAMPAAVRSETRAIRKRRK